MSDGDRTLVVESLRRVGVFEHYIELLEEGLPESHNRRYKRRLCTIGALILKMSIEGHDCFTRNELEDLADCENISDDHALAKEPDTVSKYIRFWEGLLIEVDDTSRTNVYWISFPNDGTAPSEENPDQRPVYKALLYQLLACDNLVYRWFVTVINKFANIPGNAYETLSREKSEFVQFTKEDERCISGDRLLEGIHSSAIVTAFSVLAVFILHEISAPVFTAAGFLVAGSIGLVVFTLCAFVFGLQFLSVQYVWPFLGRRRVVQ